MSWMPWTAERRLKYAICLSGKPCSVPKYAPGPCCISSVTSIQRGSSRILSGLWKANASSSRWNQSPVNACALPSKKRGGRPRTRP